MLMTRRSFFAHGLGALAAVGVPGAATASGDSRDGAASKAAGGTRLRVGILADIHLRTEGAARKFERALTAFRKGRADAVLICGDLADSGVVPQLEEVARIWERVFPGSKGIDGEHVERLFHYGDHDNRGHIHQGDHAAKSIYGWSDAEWEQNQIFRHPKETWERIFGEPWSPIVHKQVKGYDFILAHYTKKGWKSAEGLEDFLRDFKPAPGKPFFYSQHRVFRNSVCGSGVGGQDDGTVGALLSRYPQCCAFCGHSHQTAMREDSIWQGAFTAVQVPSLCYVTYEPGHENKPNGFLAEQGFFMTVCDSAISLQRVDFANKCALAPAWSIPLEEGVRPFAPETRRCTAKAPQFPQGASLSAQIIEKDGKDGKSARALALEFPLVSGIGAGERAYDYEVTVDAICFGGDAKRISGRYLPPKCMFAPAAEDSSLTVEIDLAEFTSWNSLRSRSYGALHVAVRPREIFGGTGAAIEADVQ